MIGDALDLLAPFSDISSRCPKCTATMPPGTGTIATLKYCALDCQRDGRTMKIITTEPTSMGRRGLDHEHFHRVCIACGFEWLERLPEPPQA